MRSRVVARFRKLILLPCCPPLLSWALLVEGAWGEPATTCTSTAPGEALAPSAPAGAMARCPIALRGHCGGQKRAIQG